MNGNGTMEGVRNRVKQAVDTNGNPFVKFVHRNKGNIPQLYDSGK